MNTVITTRTHQFTVRLYRGAWEAEFQPINQKTGQPWQASHRIKDGADTDVLNDEGRPMWGRPVFYSTEALAIEAVNRKANQLGRR